jgi:Ca-activated chloride channel homolog
MKPKDTIDDPELQELDWLSDIVAAAGRSERPVLEPHRIEAILRTPQVEPPAALPFSIMSVLGVLALVGLLMSASFSSSLAPKAESASVAIFEPVEIVEKEAETKMVSKPQAPPTATTYYDNSGISNGDGLVHDVDVLASTVVEPSPEVTTSDYLWAVTEAEEGKDIDSRRWAGRADKESGKKSKPAKQPAQALGLGSVELAAGRRLTFEARVNEREPQAPVKTLNALRTLSEDSGADLPPSGGHSAPPVNPFVMTARDALSTFALESEAASYVQSRRYIQAGYRPPPALVRMEEFINAFDYNYPSTGEGAFSVHAEAAPSPFGKELALVKIGVRGKVIGRDGRKPAHLVFVIDASGSMAREDRLPLVREALRLLLTQLGPEDQVSLVSYDTRPHLLLDSAPASQAATILETIDRIVCTAATNVLEGLMLGYEVAGRAYRPGAVNRIILCSDGVANVGPSDAEAMLQVVDTQRRQGIAITSVGVGAGSYNDNLMEQLANRGDGNYVYIDSPEEAHRVFVENFSATLNTIARDVKIQVAFDPKRVRRYRLIGYENRDIADRDFRNDAVDAGEIGSGQSATALYEVELHQAAREVDLGTVYVRYKEVDSNAVREFASRLRYDLVRPLRPEDSPRFFLAAAVAEFAEYLRNSEHARGSSPEDILQVLLRTSQALPKDRQVAELVDLVRRTDDAPIYSN